jgi:hypothetical protein
VHRAFAGVPLEFADK